MTPRLTIGVPAVCILLIWKWFY